MSACNDFHRDPELPDYCEGCAQPRSAHGSEMDERFEAAKRWLGDRYLLAQPINRKIRHA